MLRRAKIASGYRARLVVMVKEPVAGRVKTRLGREIGVVRATQFYRHTAAAVLARVSRDPRWQTLIAVAPDTALARHWWPKRVARVAQGEGDLGQRMRRCLGGMPPGPVIVVGTDIPAIDAEAIASAFRRLATADVVFGPAHDGGYWLVGAMGRRLPLDMFKGVRWSTEHALADTRANLEGLRIANAATLSDVDTGNELRADRGLHGRIVRPPAPCLGGNNYQPGDG